MSSPERQEDRQSFIRLATRRVNNTLKYIRLIGNLSNTSNYQYTDEDVQKIFSTLQRELDDCRERFEKRKKIRPNFTLEE
jgi:ABC-type Fe3+-hydroxamate transport system substrate-binding protein